MPYVRFQLELQIQPPEASARACRRTVVPLRHMRRRFQTPFPNEGAQDHAFAGEAACVPFVRLPSQNEEIPDQPFEDPFGGETIQVRFMFVFVRQERFFDRSQVES